MARQETIRVAEHCTELKVPEPIPQEVGARNLGNHGEPHLVNIFQQLSGESRRYPWAGSLVYTAFSGSHQETVDP